MNSNQIKLIKPNGKYKGRLICPPSKSYMQRAIAIGILKRSSTKILNPSYCEDAIALIGIANVLGFTINKRSRYLELIPGSHNSEKFILNFRESGLGIRMLSPILACQKKSFVLIGEGSLKKRPMTMIENGLRDLDVFVKSENGYIPIELHGPVKKTNIEIDGSLGSQFLSGLLIALPTLKRNSLIKVNELRSKPYIDMTLECLNHFGVELKHENYKVFKIKGHQKYQPKDYRIEGDWSSAAFHLVGAAISGEISITNINISSKQADIKILEVLKNCGAHIECKKNEVKIQKKMLQAFEFDATDCPDLFPALAVLAVACEGLSKIKGIHRLTHKESNRAETIQSELKKLSVKITLDYTNDCMIILGSEVLGGRISSHNDHRIAMMGGIVSLISKEPVVIENPRCVNKSYPNFYEDLNQLAL